LILFLLRIGVNKVAFFHLNIHAIFKSIVFIGFGFAILSSYHSQDNRIISYLFINPTIKILFYFSTLCLSGLPFLSGFFSKDFILEAVMTSQNGIFQILIFLGFLGIRIYYGFKLMGLVRIRGPISYSTLRYFGMFRLIISIIVILILVNVHVGLVISFSIIVFDFKYLVYLIIILFFIIRVYKFSNVIFLNSIISVVLKDNIIVL